MAGSFLHTFHEDPILSARIESLTLLADHLVEPVMVISPSFELVYANGAASQFTAECPLVEGVREDGVPLGRSATPCDVCQGKDELEIVETSLHSLENPKGQEGVRPCPFPNSLPLSGKEGKVGCVLMMGNTARESPVIQQVSLENRHDPLLHEDANSGILATLIGKSPAMQPVLDMIQLVAASQVTVLLQGESGTGKELVAKTIHQLSKRCDAPFVVVDCGSLPETLLESELFGHVRGAFTSAVSDRKGLFEEAHGGTIFLDEIGNTSASFQAKLLRVLQEGEVKRVGSSQVTKVDVRVISASNKPLEDLIKSSGFRADLYYRLAVIPIVLPPLRDRHEDIPLLIEYFLKQACKKNGKVCIEIHPEALQVLMRKPWPGNVRELEHTVERLALMSDGPQITINHVDGPRRKAQEVGDLYSAGKHARVSAERARILKVMSQTKGNKVQAAKLLHISRAGLYNKLREYHLT